MKKIILFCLCLSIVSNCCAQTDVKNDITTVSDKNLSNEQIVIKGTVTFNDYKQGYICIYAMQVLDRNSCLNYIKISKPGPYTLLLPPDTKDIRLGCYNDIDDDGGPLQPHDPVGWYEANGIKGLLIIYKDFLENIDLAIPHTAK